MKLKVKSRYRGSYQGPSGARQLLEYTPGEIEVDDLVGEYLLKDSPGSFGVAKEKPAAPAAKAPVAPAVNKMIEEPKKKKGRKAKG